MTVTNQEAWIRRFWAGADDRHSLLCFPHAGGSASFFHKFSVALSAGTEVLAVQYPGRQDRRAEALVDDIHELAGQVAAVLTSRPDRPKAFFGHSMGAIIAFEVARLLERSGCGPVLLFASGRRAPSRYRHETVHLRDDQGLVEEIRALSGTDQTLLSDEDVLAMILPALRADYRAIETYVCPAGPPLRCPIVAMVGDSDPRVSLDDAGAWRSHTSSDFELRVFSGGHFFLDDRHGEVAAAVTEILDGYSAGTFRGDRESTPP